MITPTTDAAWVNSVLNDPNVRPWIADMSEGEIIDVSEHLARPSVMALRGEHGLFMVYRLDAGIYEVHTAILPEGRGKWALKFAEAGADFMFTRTDCVELLTRVPVPHEAAWMLTVRMGFRLQFETLPETRFRDELVPVRVYSLSLQDWANDAPGMEDQGCLFHAWLNEQVRTYGLGLRDSPPHPNDLAHNQTVGVVLAMIKGGQVMKGVVWYNRWACLSRHEFISIVGESPIRIRFDAGVLEMKNDGSISYLASTK